MQSAIFHLIGKPGVGKYTIGAELARLTGARLVDNHSINNVIFNLVNADGITPLPAEIWPRVSQVRAAVLDTLVHVSPLDLSFVFTNFLRGDDDSEQVGFMELAAVAEARGSIFVPVILSCVTAELVRRIVQPDRRARMKMVDPVQGARLNDDVPQFRSDLPNTLELDVSQTAPGDAAQAIVDWLARLRE
jgi:hypothetical protein